ncbi:RNA polymerase sigma-70 factor [Aestuariivivens sp. NBU2969]|uniref:RNA polymerase sigma-70 factor n=1 Tax=Aestuariivivens sp. NBU2969 TaxID=2873267 RepID=UPI001CBBD237|nr:RNA polymerase sigma-70 factor [Aestuariivivens sp. NBU2969]
MNYKKQFKKTIPLNKTSKKDLFDLLYNLHYDLLLQIVRQYVPSIEDAEEVLQDVFMKIWYNFEKIDMNKNVTGYLFKITRNTCLDFLRSKRHALALETNSIQQKNLLNFHALTNDTASTIIKNELVALINESIESLPEKCRLVFIKSRFEGMKHKQISSELDISNKTVENHISKAIKHLRKSLKDYLPFL